MFPNATVSEYGKYKEGREVDVVRATMAEIFARGPVAAAVNAKPLHSYRGGIYANESDSKETTHIVSIIGWGTNEEGVKFWVCRNSWGQYWGEMGFFRIKMGENILGIESDIAWATPGNFTVVNYPCYEDGKNCGPETRQYEDPWHSVAME